MDYYAKVFCANTIERRYTALPPGRTADIFVKYAKKQTVIFDGIQVKKLLHFAYYFTKISTKNQIKEGSGMKRSFNRTFTTASADETAEASSSCADSSDVMLALDTVLPVSVFVITLLERINIRLLRRQERGNRLKTQALIA